MPEPKPFKHMYRYGPGSVTDPFREARRAPIALVHVGAYELLLRDLTTLFEFIEPTVANRAAYSHRTFELLFRACTEVESNIKTIFDQNQVVMYRHHEDMRGYADLDGPMKLASYELVCRATQLPPFRPFESFNNPERDLRSPGWYRAYNHAKHDRAKNFEEACLGNVVEAVGAVFCLLAAQYGFGMEPVLGSVMGVSTGVKPLPFGITEKPVWTAEEEYAFDWAKLSAADGDPWQYHKIPKIE